MPNGRRHGQKRLAQPKYVEVPHVVVAVTPDVSCAPTSVPGVKESRARSNAIITITLPPIGDLSGIVSDGLCSQVPGKCITRRGHSQCWMKVRIVEQRPFCS